MKIPPNGQIGGEVPPVGMQGEGGDQPPPLAIQDSAGLGGPEGDPVGGTGKLHLGDVVKGRQQDQDRERRQGVLRKLLPQGGRWRPVAVVLMIAAQFVQGVRMLFRRHQQAPVAISDFDEAGDRPRIQHQGPLANLPAARMERRPGPHFTGTDLLPLILAAGGMLVDLLHGHTITIPAALCHV